MTTISTCFLRFYLNKILIRKHLLVYVRTCRQLKRESSGLPKLLEKKKKRNTRIACGVFLRNLTTCVDLSGIVLRLKIDTSRW